MSTFCSPVLWRLVLLRWAALLSARATWLVGTAALCAALSAHGSPTHRASRVTAVLSGVVTHVTDGDTLAITRFYNTS